VSWLSPSLANRSTLKSTKQRVTVVTRDEGVALQKRRSLPANLSNNPEEEVYRHSQSGAVQSLKNRVQADLDESFMFENRLHAALLKD